MTTQEGVNQKTEIVRKFLAVLNEEIVALNQGPDEEKLLRMFAVYQATKALGKMGDLIFAMAVEGLPAKQAEGLREVLEAQLQPLLDAFALTLKDGEADTLPAPATT